MGAYRDITVPCPLCHGAEGQRCVNYLKKPKMACRLDRARSTRMRPVMDDPRPLVQGELFAGEMPGGEGT